MEITPQEFREVQQLVRSLCGLVLTDDKTYLVRTRLESVVKRHGHTTFLEYLVRLRQPSSMLDELVEELTTGETSFNRDGHPFDEFQHRILPAIAESIRRRRLAGHTSARGSIWSAGCSTGQEPYSLAIAIREFLRLNSVKGLSPQDFHILATDVSEKSLKFARDGRYAEWEVARGLKPEVRNRYFQSGDSSWTINPEVRNSVEFRRMNFIERRGNLGPFDLILCRNVLIYFDATVRQKLCEQFEQLLVPQGMLMIGSAENLYGLKTTLNSEELGSTVVYRKP